VLESSYDISQDEDNKAPPVGFGDFPVLDSDGPVEDDQGDEAQEAKEEEKTLNADII